MVFQLNTRNQKMKPLSAQIDLSTQYINFTIGKRCLKRSFEPNRNLNQPIDGEIRDEGFTVHLEIWA